MSSPAVQAELVLALSDLKLVRLLRDAIAIADIQSGIDKSKPIQTVVEHEPARRLTRCDDYCHQPHRTEVVYRDRPITRTTRVVESKPVEAPLPPSPSARCDAGFKIQPPWKVLPWQEPVQLSPKIKIIQYRPDIRHKGTLLDYFI